MIDERLDRLVRARVAATKRRPKLEAVVKAIAPFAPDTMPASELRDRIAASLERETTDGETDDWKSLVEQTGPSEILGVDRVAFKSRDAWASAIVGRVLGLWTEGAPPKLPTLCDALVWRELGLTGTPKKCPDEIRAVFVQRRGQLTGSGRADRQLRVLAAREVRAVRAETKLLRNALVRMWLEGGSLGGSFIDDLRAVVQTTKHGVFGDRKVFIAAAWRDLVERPAWASLALDDFKRRVLAAHRAGDVQLARADLIGAMDPELVHASETTAAGARFHFVVREMP